MRHNEPSEFNAVFGGVLQRALHGVPLLATLAVALCAIAVVVFSRDDDRSQPLSPIARRDDVAMTTAPTLGTRTEVVARLREILAIQDRAIQARNAHLLDDIYSVDCECLEDSRALIQQLRQEGIVWKGLKTGVTINEVEEVSDRLWTIVATVTTPSVRIETESGQLVRVVPPERNVIRFGLARPTNEEEWLLGHASLINYPA